jgi:hypothetical protein
MRTSPIALTAVCAFALSVAAPLHARDDSGAADPAGTAQSDEPGRGSRESLPPEQSAVPDASQTAQQPLPQGADVETTNPAESQVGADPKKSRAKRDPTAQSPADPVDAPPPAADAAAEGARGPRGDDESRARSGVPEYEGPVQAPGEPADPNLKPEQAR